MQTQTAPSADGRRLNARKRVGNEERHRSWSARAADGRTRRRRRHKRHFSRKGGIPCNHVQEYVMYAFTSTMAVSMPPRRGSNPSSVQLPQARPRPAPLMPETPAGHTPAMCEEHGKNGPSVPASMSIPSTPSIITVTIMQKAALPPAEGCQTFFSAASVSIPGPCSRPALMIPCAHTDRAEIPPRGISRSSTPKVWTAERNIRHAPVAGRLRKDDGSQAADRSASFQNMVGGRPPPAPSA